MRSASASSSPARTLPAQPPGPRAGRRTYGSRNGAASSWSCSRGRCRIDTNTNAPTLNSSDQLWGRQPAGAQGAVLNPSGREPAVVGERGQQQGVQPQQRPDEQSGERAGATGAAPVQPADQRRSELRDCGEREQAA